MKRYDNRDLMEENIISSKMAGIQRHSQLGTKSSALKKIDPTTIRAEKTFSKKKKSQIDQLGEFESVSKVDFEKRHRTPTKNKHSVTKSVERKGDKDGKNVGRDSLLKKGGSGSTSTSAFQTLYSLKKNEAVHSSSLSNF